MKTDNHLFMIATAIPAMLYANNDMSELLDRLVL